MTKINYWIVQDAQKSHSQQDKDHKLTINRANSGLKTEGLMSFEDQANLNLIRYEIYLLLKCMAVDG